MLLRRNDGNFGKLLVNSISKKRSNMVIFCQDNLFRIRPKTNKYKPTKHYIQLGFHLRI